MKSTIRFREMIYHAGLGIIITLVISLIFSSSNGLQGSDFFRGLPCSLPLRQCSIYEIYRLFQAGKSE